MKKQNRDDAMQKYHAENRISVSSLNLIAPFVLSKPAHFDHQKFNLHSLVFYLVLFFCIRLHVSQFNDEKHACMTKIFNESSVAVLLEFSAK